MCETYFTLSQPWLRSRISGATGTLIVSVLGAISAYEREINAERREFGYRKAYAEGRVGRKKVTATKAFYEAVRRWRAGEITAVKAMERSGLKKTAFYQLVKTENV